MTFPQHKNELNEFLFGEYDSLLRFGHDTLLKAEFEKYLEKHECDNGDEASAIQSAKNPTVINSPDLRLTPVIHRSQVNMSLPNFGTMYINYSSKQSQNSNIGKIAEKTVYE
jgi:hypothetical protein